MASHKRRQVCSLRFPDSRTQPLDASFCIKLSTSRLDSSCSSQMTRVHPIPVSSPRYQWYQEGSVFHSRLAAPRLFFPSGQKSRRSSGSPACLKGSEQGLAPMTEAKARELLVLGDRRLVTQHSPGSAGERGGPLDQLLPPSGLMLPPLLVGDRTSVAQQIGSPT